MKKTSLCCFIILNYASSIAQINLSNSVKYEVVYELIYQINKEDTTDINTENMLLEIEDKYFVFSSYNAQKIKATLMGMGKTGNVDLPKITKDSI